MIRPLAQVALAATTLTEVYRAQAIGSGFVQITAITVCNRSATSATFRISLAVGNEADATKQYLFYDVPILPNDTAVFTSKPASIGMAAGDVLRAYASTANLTVQVFGE